MSKKLTGPAITAALFATLFSFVVGQCFAQSDVNTLLAAQRADAPGCSIGIAQDGVVRYERAFGLASLELKVPLQTDSVFQLESMSKQFTGMSVMLLVTAGKLSLSDEVHKYLPELPNYGHPITIAELLHHTSGLKDDSQLLMFSGIHLMDVATQQMALNLILKQKELNFVPNSEFSYSDTNYFLLGLIVERISGQSLSKFANERIFIPLKMTHTRFRDDAAMVIPQAASGYRKRANDWRKGDDESEIVGDSGVFSTVADLLKWDENFYTHTVGGTEASTLMLQQSQLNDGSVNTYSAGLEKKAYRGLTVIQHAGDGPGFQTIMMRYPDQHFAVVVLCNSRDYVSPLGLAQKVSDIYLSAWLKPPPSAKSELPYDVAAYKKFAGVYWDGKTDLLREISIKGGKLMQRLLPDDEPRELHFVSNDEFGSGAGASYRFSNRGLEFSRIVSGSGTAIYRRLADSDLKPQSASPFSGEFYSESIGVGWTFRTNAGRLVLVRNGFPDEILDFAFHDSFFGDLGLFQFHKDATGKVNRMVVMNYRLGSVTFEKERSNPNHSRKPTN